MWTQWLVLTGLIVASLLQGGSGAAVGEDDEADSDRRAALRYVFDRFFQRDLQSESATDNEIILRRKRAVIISTADDFTVEKGEDVTLPCEVNNPGRNYIVWKKDGTDIIKVKKMGRKWKVARRYSILHIDTGDMSLDETSLTLHDVDVDDQGEYSCTVEGQDTKVEHTLTIQDHTTVTTDAPSDNEDEDYYDDYYENYDDIFGNDKKDEPENKEDKEEIGTNKYETFPEEEHSKSSSNEEELGDDYYDDYYKDLFDENDNEETEVEDPEEIETTVLPPRAPVERSTTETPTEAPPPEPTEPARTWGWSFWGRKPITTVQTTTTSEPPTTTERTMESEDDEYSYDYDEYDDESEEDEKDIENEENISETDEKNQDKESFNDVEELSNDDEKNVRAEALQVAVDKKGMACLACTLPLMGDDHHGQEDVEWKHNNITISPDGESIVALRDGDMHTLLLTSVRREDLGEYRCIVGENEAVIHLVAFPTKPIYKMVDKNSDGNYKIVWEAKGLVPIDSYSITYRERNSPSEWWQQEGPFEVSPSSDDTYSHTFHNLQPYSDYEAIVSTIYQDMATTGDPFPFSVKRTGDMYPSSQKPGNGLVRAWMKQPTAQAKDQALELVCIMDTKRRTKVQWFHGHDPDAPVEDGKRITSYQKGKKNILKFTSVEPSDLGEYRCQGQTPSGIKEATVQLVAFPPPANNQEITELTSGIYKLTWESTGLAPVSSYSITYRKRDSTSEGWHQIGPIQVKDDTYGDKYSYVFTNLQPSSSYDAIVSTIYRDLATTGEPFSFTTKDASPVVTSTSNADMNSGMGSNVRVWMEQPVVHADIGTSSQLVCVMEDEQHDMQVEWYHGQHKVLTDNQRSITREDNRSILQFSSITTEDLGTYQCIAYNKFGQTNAFARLTSGAEVSISPPRGVLRSEDVTQWWSLTQAIFSDVHKYLKTLTRIPQPTDLVFV
ncbi:unnamed protein product, partial [Meganyctiphanes norvegica]